MLVRVRIFRAREAHLEKITNEARKAEGFSCTRGISAQIYKYYEYKDRYEFTLTPLNYYERQKIKLKLRSSWYSLEHLYSLKHLDNCKVILIGNWIATKYATGLQLDNTKLTVLSSMIGKLRLLKYLYISHNKLTNLPASIGNLKSLKQIYIGGNKITYLPSSIGNLKSLECLYMPHNQLTELPSSIGNLKALKWLCIYDNPLINLPLSIYNLKALEFLSIHNNQLTDEYITHIYALLPKLIIQVIM